MKDEGGILYGGLVDQWTTESPDWLEGKPEAG
jgi:hypothetical protein